MIHFGRVKLLSHRFLAGALDCQDAFGPGAAFWTEQLAGTVLRKWGMAGGWFGLLADPKENHSLLIWWVPEAKKPEKLEHGLA